MVIRAGIRNSTGFGPWGALQYSPGMGWKRKYWLLARLLPGINKCVQYYHQSKARVKTCNSGCGLRTRFIVSARRRGCRRQCALACWPVLREPQKQCSDSVVRGSCKCGAQDASVSRVSGKHLLNMKRYTHEFGWRHSVTTQTLLGVYIVCRWSGEPSNELKAFDYNVAS